MTDDKLTRVLGWASAGLGPPLLLAPVRSARVLGIEDGPRPRAILAGVGVRELTAAPGLLGQRSPRWLWSRLVGDLIDLALLGRALRRLPRARGPQAVLERDAQITDDVPGERIAWRSVDGSKVRTGGGVRFNPAADDRGTEVRVTLRYALPGGRRGRALARYFGADPGQQLDDLRRFEQVLEAGQLVASEKDNREKVVLAP
jgi:hypothetical protein